MNDKISNSASRLKQLIEYKNITQTELSNRTKVSKSSISHYIKGDWEPKQDVIYAISSAYGISPAWLLGYDVPMEATTKINDLTHAELDLLNFYRSLSEDEQDAFLRIYKIGKYSSNNSNL